MWNDASQHIEDAEHVMSPHTFISQTAVTHRETALRDTEEKGNSNPNISESSHISVWHKEQQMLSQTRMLNNIEWNLTCCVFSGFSGRETPPSVGEGVVLGARSWAWSSAGLWAVSVWYSACGEFDFLSAVLNQFNQLNQQIDRVWLFGVGPNKIG